MAASATITVAGQAIESRVLNLYIAGEQVQVVVASGEDAAAIINWLLPERGLLQINEFTGAVLASAFSVALIQYAYSIIDRRNREETDL